jgi:predicted N-acetyltransferase YhbS
VHNLRNDESLVRNLAYVIEDDGIIVGHINYSIGKIHYENHVFPAVILGPVAVDETRQNQGLGTRLISHTLKIAEEDKIPFILVVGDENYYSRFGFESASKYGIYLEGTGLDEENPFFMIKIFDGTELADEAGIFHSPDVFDVDENELDEFDRQFEYKEKLVLDTQLKEL